MLRPYLAGFISTGRRLRARGGGAGARGNRTIAAGSSLLDRIDRFGGRHERRGLNVFHAATGCEGEGDGRSADVVWHLEDAHNVKRAKRKERSVHAAAELFDRCANRICSVLRISQQTGPGLLGIAALQEKMWHRILLLNCEVSGQAGGAAQRK